MRAFGIAVAILVVVAIAPSIAVGAPASAVLDSAQVTLTSTDAGWSTSVGVMNLTDGPLALTARTGRADCALRVGDGTTVLPAARHETVTVSIPAGCKAGDGLSFVLEARGGEASQSFTVDAAPKKTTTVYWSSLLSFAVAFGVALAVIAVTVGFWHHSKRVRPFTPLKGLTATFSFKDSILSNVTAASGLVAVVLGSSDFLKAVLGSDAEAAIAVAAIAGAIALALVGAAGVLVLTVKKPGQQYIAVAGLCAGYVVAFCAAGGQVWTVTLLVLDLDIGTGAAWAVGIAGVVASLLLAAYASISLIDLLIQGTESHENDLLEHPMPVEGPPVGCAPSAGGSVPYEDVKKLLRQLEKAEPRGEVHDIRVVAEPTRLLHPLETRSAMP